MRKKVIKEEERDLDVVLNAASKEWFKYTQEEKEHVFHEFRFHLHMYVLSKWEDDEALEKMSSLLNAFRNRLLANEYYEALAVVTEFCDYYEI